MKIRAFLVLLLLVSACSRESVGFADWVRSPAALERMNQLASNPTFEDVNAELESAVTALVGDGTVPPMVALERYFLNVPAEELLGSENLYGNMARRFLAYVSSGKKFKQDDAYELELSNLWATQLFRTLPLTERVDLLKRPILLNYADKSEEGVLLPFQENRKADTAEKFAAELSRAFVPTSETMTKFRSAIRTP
jgi:hypothetical protein